MQVDAQSLIRCLGRSPNNSVQLAMADSQQLVETFGDLASAGILDKYNLDTQISTT
jgi:hypothetical protein